MENVNRKISQYNIHNEYESGLVLTGAEVKSIRKHGIDISNAFIYIDKNGEAWLTNSVVQKMKEISTHELFETNRTRKILLTKRELDKIKGQLSEKGYTCVPKKVFFKKQYIKCIVCLVSGKKEYDKRQDIKIRETNEEMRRALKKEQKTNF